MRRLNPSVCHRSERLLDDLFASHGVSIDAEPTPDGVQAMQRLIDGVPERWRDADRGLVAHERERDVGHRGAVVRYPSQGRDVPKNPRARIFEILGCGLAC